MSRPFAAGEQVLLIDSKKRRYLITLTAGKEFHSHSGVIGHDAVIGAVEGTAFRSTHGLTYTAIRPTLGQVDAGSATAWAIACQRSDSSYRQRRRSGGGVDDGLPAFRRHDQDLR